LYTVLGVALLDDTVVADKHREAAAMWPQVSVPLGRFREVLEAGIAAGGTTLETIHAGDLYLVAAILAGDAAAVAVLENDVMGQVHGSIVRACKPNGNPEDTVQTTLAKLLTGPPEPKLAQYTGKGPLVGWVRVIAVREALQAQRKTKKEVLGDEELLTGRGATAASVEMKMLKDIHGPSFGKAVQDAMRRLTSEQRALLRFSVRDGLTIDQIAPMLGIHRATAARRLEKARMDALAHTQAILRERHGLSDSEAKSLCLALGREVDVSLGRALSDEGMR
jgi:RNA polymerase sigma-70 factor (ECF subfamily)